MREMIKSALKVPGWDKDYFEECGLSIDWGIRVVW